MTRGLQYTHILSCHLAVLSLFGSADGKSLNVTLTVAYPSLKVV